MDPLQMQEIKDKIDSLTVDEDVRQSLWLAVLQKPDIDIDSAIEDIFTAEKKEIEITDKIAKSIQHAPDQKTVELLSCFSPEEQSVMSLLMLGIDVYSISRYKSLKLAWLKQMIRSIHAHPVWEISLGKEIKNRSKIWPNE